MKEKARVGLIIDNKDQSRQLKELIEMSRESDVYEISHLIVQNLPKVSTVQLFKKNGILKFLSILSFNFISKIEEFYLKSKSQNKKFATFFKKYNIDEFGLPIFNVYPKISQSGFVFKYSNEDLEKIKIEKIDILVRCGSGILKGEILNVCKKGIISFHHGDNKVNRGSPPGFWEVLERHKSTGFIIQILTEELDGGEILFKGNIATSNLYTLNKIKLYRKSNIFMHKTLESLFQEAIKKRFYDKHPYSHLLYKLPSLTNQFKYLFITGLYLIKKLKRKFFGKYSWGVAYQFVDDWKNVTLWKSKIIKNPPNRFLADPFIITNENKHFCFLENYSYKSKKGAISVYEIEPSGEKSLGIALEENFHLSYPFLLKDKGILYMCPETSKARDIRIYKCLDFPLNWKLEKVLMTNVDAADTSIFKYQSKWWMMTNIDSSNNGDHDSELHIFSSDELLSNSWTPHILNPVIFDSERARNGGLIAHNNEFYRVFQKQGFDLYGEAFGVAKITSLNQEKYEEEIKFEITPNFIKNSIGTHTLNFENGLLATDFFTYGKVK